MVGPVGDGAQAKVARFEFAYGVLAVEGKLLVGLGGVAYVAVGGEFFWYVGAQEGDEERRGGVGFSHTFEGEDLEAVGEAEVGDFESAVEAEGVVVFPVLGDGNGYACQVGGLGDGAVVRIGIEVGVLLNPYLTVVVCEHVEADVEVAFELVGLVLRGDAELVELVVFV